MTQSIKLSTDQMRLISLFQNVTKVTAHDCLDDEKQDRIIFVVNTGKMGLATVSYTHLTLPTNREV